MKFKLSDHQTKGRVLRNLQKHFFLRFHMSLILGGALAAGGLTSYALVHWGVDQMALRFGICVILAYLCFFGLVRIWLWYASGIPPVGNDTTVDLVPDGIDLASSAFPLPSRGNFGGGGRFGGAGANGDYGDGAETGGGSGPDLDLVPDIDVGEELGVVLIILGAILFGLFGAFFWVFWTSPLILSEVLFELLLAGGMLRSLPKVREVGWEETLFRKTWVPALVVLVLVCAAGWVLQTFVPGVVRVSDLWWWYFG